MGQGIFQSSTQVSMVHLSRKLERQLRSSWDGLWLRGSFQFLPEAICKASLRNKGLQEFPFTHCGSSLPTSLFPFLRTSSCLIVARNIHASGFNTRAPNFSQDVSCIVGRLLVKSIYIRIEISQKSPSVILEIMLLL